MRGRQPFEARIVRVTGVPVRYAVAGRGSPLVLIHGLAASLQWWSRNVPEREPKWVRSVLQVLGIVRPSIIGHSMGGPIALSFAARWPDQVDRLVLAAAAVDLPHGSVLGSIVPLVTALRYVSPGFFPTLVGDAVHAGPATLVRAVRSVLRFTSGEQASAVPAPTLLLWGDHDRLVPLVIGEALSRAIGGSQLEVIQGAGHILMFDRPAEFNAHVLRFLAGASTNDAPSRGSGYSGRRLLRFRAAVQRWGEGWRPRDR